MTTLMELAGIIATMAEKSKTPTADVLWQVLEKVHIAPDADDEEWEAFVRDNEDYLADELSIIAGKYWENQD